MVGECLMQAAILIGGLGTRLGAAVRDLPKPLLEVGGRPFLEHLLLNLRRFGFDDFLLLAGYRAGAVRERYGPDSAFVAELGAAVTVIEEPEPLGTAGAVKHAQDRLQPSFLLLNGDSLFDFNYLDLCCVEQDNEPADWLGRVALRPVDDASRYGLVGLNGSLITAFREKPDRPQPGLINAGIYWLKRELVEWIPDGRVSLEQEVFPRLAVGAKLVGRAYQGFFIDIGIPQDLARARQSLVESLRKPAVFLDRDGTLNHDAGYTYRIEDFRWIEGAPAAIKRLNDAGYLVFVVSNQAGIARGYYDRAAVERLHGWMQEQLRRLGAHIDAIRICPHHLEGKIAALAVDCACRKPKPGMLLDLIDAWQPQLEQSLMLGDRPSDCAAGSAAGVPARLVPTGQILPIVESILS